MNATAAAEPFDPCAVLARAFGNTAACWMKVCDPAAPDGYSSARRAAHYAFLVDPTLRQEAA